MDKNYWIKTIKNKYGELKVLEIYLGEDGLYRVYTDRNAVALVFGSWNSIFERFQVK